jgi:hypothetical protein
VVTRSVPWLGAMVGRRSNCLAGAVNGEKPRPGILKRKNCSLCRPLADTFEQWLHAKLALISQKGKLPDAVRYALTRWRGLTRFIDDGCIEIDNNTVERSIRPICSTGKMLCSQAPMVAPSIGPSLPH